MTHKLNAHAVRAVAVASYTDPRTVKAYLAGTHATRPTAAERIAAAIKSLGYQIESNRHEAPQATAA